MNQIKNKEGYFRQILHVINLINQPKNKEIKIPVELCFFVIKEKLLPSFKIYILLKMISSGKIVLKRYDKILLADFCGYKTSRSFDNHLQKLIALNWIGYNKGSGYFHIRGFGYVQKKYHMTARTGFWFAIQDMQCFDGVIYGAVIGYLSKHQGKKQGTGAEKGTPKQIPCKTPGFYPISNWFLAKILNISVSTASLMKRRADEAESIYIKRKRIVEPATHDVFKRLSETYPHKYLKPIVWKGIFYQRLPDLVRPNLKYGTRKKIDK